jgi:hypothetical protein
MTIIIGLAALRWKSFEEEKGEGESELIKGEDIIESLDF